MESPLLWLRADPEMEYLAEIQFHQPVQMWVSEFYSSQYFHLQATCLPVFYFRSFELVLQGFV